MRFSTCIPAIAVPAAVAVLLALAAAPASADAISERQDTMKDIGKNLKVLVKTIKGEAAFDGAAISGAGDAIAADFAEARTLFPGDSKQGGDTRAKPEIWQDMAAFLAIFDRGEAAAKDVAAAGEAGDEGAFKAAFAALGGACKDCHETYRAPKN